MGVEVTLRRDLMSKEKAFLTQSEEAIERKAPFSAVVYAFLGLIEVFKDIRNSLRDITAMMEREERRKR